MNIEDKLSMLDNQILNISFHISNLSTAIQEGAVSNKEKGLEYIKIDLERGKAALEQHRSTLTNSI
ncbi:MAG: hypothetical protein ACO3DP_01295 [Candidatus Nanopelagicaceae bacterium]